MGKTVTVKLRSCPDHRIPPPAARQCLAYRFRLKRYLTRAGWIGAGMVLAVAVLGLLASWLSAHPPDVPSGPPLEPPGGDHLLGTDDLGLDLWAQICYGARVSLVLALAVALLAGLGGGCIGLWAGYVGGRADRILMRLVDVTLILPQLPVLILVAAFLGPSLPNVILALVLFSWTQPARTLRAQALSLKQRGYIRAAQSYGAGPYYILRRHLLPELLPLILVSMVRLASRGVVAEAGLAFLGLGDPTVKTWGMILHQATAFKGLYFTPFWKWWLVAPWTALTSLVVGLGLLARDLERLADPRLRG